MCVPVFVLRLLLFPWGGGKTRVFSSAYKLTELILQTGCPSYYLTSCGKSAPIQKPSLQIPKALKVACGIQLTYLKEEKHHFFLIFRNTFLKHVGMLLYCV